MDALKHFATPCLKENPPAFSIGDTVRVGVRIKEGEKSRVQAFEGTVIAKKHGGIQETFTVRPDVPRRRRRESFPAAFAGG